MENVPNKLGYINKSWQKCNFYANLGCFFGPPGSPVWQRKIFFLAGNFKPWPIVILHWFEDCFSKNTENNSEQEK